MSNKAVFLLGDLNSLDYDNNELVKNFFNLVFQIVFLPLIQRPARVTRITATAIDHILTNRVLENKTQSGIIKTAPAVISQYSLGKMNETYSLEKIKFIKRDISIEKILMLLNSYDTAFPKREIEIKTQHLQSPWITRCLQKSFKRKQRLYEKVLKKEKPKIILNIRNINISLKKKSLKQTIISIN